MHIQQIKDDLNNTREEFNKRISEIENKLEQKQSSKRWKPEIGEEYFFVSDSGYLISGRWSDSYYTNFTYSQGNCFKTKEEAKDHLENLKTKAELRALAEELNGDEVINWSDAEQEKYYFFLDFDVSRRLRVSSDCYNQIQGVIYCLDPNFLDKAAERIGEDRLIKMIKSGV